MAMPMVGFAGWIGWEDGDGCTPRSVCRWRRGGGYHSMGGDQVADDGSVAFAVAVDGDDKRCCPRFGGGWGEEYGNKRPVRADFD